MSLHAKLERTINYENRRRTFQNRMKKIKMIEMTQAVPFEYPVTY